MKNARSIVMMLALGAGGVATFAAASAQIMTGATTQTVAQTVAQQSPQTLTQHVNEGEVMGSNGIPQTADLRSPEWIADVLDPTFDASFQDTRTDTYIQHEVARVIADGRYVMVMGDPNTQFPRVAMCFAEGYEPTQQIIDAVNQAIMGGFGERFQIGGSWNGTSANAVRTLSWSFMPDTVFIPGNIGEPDANSSLFATFDAQFANNGGRATWIAQFQSVFNRWSALTGLTYERRTASGVEWDDGAAWNNGSSPTRGDIRIGAHPIDGPGGILAYNQFPGGGSGGDMVIDSQDTWDSTAGTFRFLRNVIAHEHGHGIGLAHVCPLGTNVNTYKLMEPFISTSYDGPQQDDVRGAQFNYGDASEPNNSSTAFTDLGTLASGSTTNLGTVPAPAIPNSSTLSIVSRTSPIYTDFDYFRQTLDAPRLVTFTVGVVGNMYTAGAQTQTCNTGTSINSLSTHDLRMVVYRSNGTTELANINAAGIASGESAASVLLPAGNTFFVVTNATGTSGTQMYTASIQVLSTGIAPIATDSLFTDRVRITWPTIANAAQYRVRRSTVDNYLSSGTLDTLAAPATQFNDTTAVPGTQYYYWLDVNQTYNAQFITTTVGGELGMRGVAANVPPTANAGSDQTVADTDNSGSESVTLNGSLSSDSDGTITNYTWRRSGNVILTGVTGQVSLPLGTNTIELTVTDDDLATAVDTVIVTVNQQTCDSIDFNNDGATFDPQDIDAFLSVFSEGGCIPETATCNDIDFNNDGSLFDPLDIESFLSVFGEGPCL